jgi:P pilus assembly chaperone PapD
MKKLLLRLYSLLLLLIPAGSNAQITFSPDMLTLDIEKQHSASAEVVLTNKSEVTKKIFVEVEYRCTAGDHPGKIEKWVDFSPRVVTMRPGTTRPIQVRLKGGNVQYRGECLLSFFASEEIKSRINLNIRTGMPIFVRWNGENRAEGKIVSIRPKFSGGGKFSFSVEVKNTGALHLAPYGVAWVEKSDGEHLWQVEVRPDQPIFPGETKELVWEGKRPKVLADGEQLGVRLFWGTLYGLDKLGAPKSAEMKVRLKAGKSLR